MPKADPQSVVQKGASAPAKPGGNIGPAKGDPQAEKLEAKHDENYMPPEVAAALKAGEQKQGIGKSSL